VIVHDEPNLYRGVIGRVFADGKFRCADDVRDGRWPDYYGNPHTRSELVVPIKPSPDAELIGAFAFESPVRAAFSADVVARIERLAGVAALALDNIRRQARANAVLDATRTVAEPIAAKATFAAVERVLREAVPDLSTLALWHLTPSGKFRLGAQFGADDELPVGTENDAETVTIRRVIESELPIFATNARLQSPDSTFIERQGIKSFAAFPLRAQDHNVGAMFLNFRHVREFSTDEKHVLSALAAIVAASIRDALMVDRLEMQADWLKAAQDVGEAVGTTNTLQDVLHKIMTKLKELYLEAQVCIYTYQPGNAQLTVAPASMDFYQFDHIEQTRELDVRTEGTSIASRVARQTLDSRKIEVENVRYSPGDPDFVSGTAGMQSELCASLVAGDGQLLGTLILESPKRDAFVDDDVEKIRGIARQISLSIERSKLAGQLRSSTALAAKIAWAADIAHDIEPQIEAIRTRLMWLQEEMAGSQVARQLLCEIDESAAMLDRAAQNAAFFDFEASEVFGIDAYLRDEIMGIVHGKPTVNINVVWRLSCPSARVQVNRASLYGIVSHLVRNAIEAMGREGILTVHSFERPNWVEVHIEDSGHGLESRVRDQIFLHSVSTKRIGHSRRGNGLLIAQLLAEQMKGSIRLIRSESGAGTTFGFNLPIAK
jgi:GAF domain-containing protein